MSPVVYLCSDLLFTSKIRETAQALGLAAEAARDAGTLAALAAGARCVVVDLRRPDALLALDGLRTADAPYSIGFCDHERVERMDEARAHGCTEVVAKGKFSAYLRLMLQPAPAPVDDSGRPAA